MITTVNPSTGETQKSFEPLSEAQIEAKLQRAADIFRGYRGSAFDEREPLMLPAAEILESEKHECARVMPIEMSKPIKAAVQEVEQCAWVCRYYAENARRHLADRVTSPRAPGRTCCFVLHSNSITQLN